MVFHAHIIIIQSVVHTSSLFRNEEKLVALLVYSSFIRVATRGFRMFPKPLVVEAGCAQMRSDSGITPYSPQHCSTV